MRSIRFISHLGCWRSLGSLNVTKAAMISCMILSVAPAAIIQSQFDTDLEGWTSLSDPGSVLSYQPAGGNPGGYLGYSEAGGFSFDYLLAPAKFLGDKSAFYGGAISIDIKDTSPNVRSQHPIIINNGSLFLDSAGIAPTSAFATYTFPLTAGNWRVASDGPLATQAQILDVLSNLHQMRIIADYDPNAVELFSLDNVILTPEPSVAVLLFCGVALLILKR